MGNGVQYCPQKYIGLNMFIDIQTSKELIQMDINKMITGTFTNGSYTQSVKHHRIIPSRKHFEKNNASLARPVFEQHPLLYVSYGCF